MQQGISNWQWRLTDTDELLGPGYNIIIDIHQTSTTSCSYYCILIMNNVAIIIITACTFHLLDLLLSINNWL